MFKFSLKKALFDRRPRPEEVGWIESGVDGASGGRVQTSGDHPHHLQTRSLESPVV